MRDYFRPLVYFGGRLPTVVAADAGNPTPVGPRTSVVYCQASVRLFLCWQPSWYLKRSPRCPMNASVSVMSRFTSGKHVMSGQRTFNLHQGCLLTPVLHLAPQKRFCFISRMNPLQCVRSKICGGVASGNVNNLFSRNTAFRINECSLCLKPLRYWGQAICLFLCLTLFTSISLSVYLRVCPSIRPPTQPPTHPSIHLFIYLYFYHLLSAYWLYKQLLRKIEKGQLTLSDML